MIDIKERVKIINSYLEQDTQPFLLLAALESRLTIEAICYDRFKQNHSYLSERDLKAWNPADVVEQVSNEVSSYANDEFTLSIAMHDPNSPMPESKEDFEKLDFKVVGKQAKINLSKAKRLWNALSNVALHVPVSFERSEIYGDSNKIRKKVLEALAFFNSLSEGSLILGGGFSPFQNFNCVSCDLLIKKYFSNLTLPSVVSCTNPRCMESYLLTKDEKDEFIITRRCYSINCEKCGTNYQVPHRMLDKLTHNGSIKSSCDECGFLNILVLRPTHKTTKSSC
ncbi:hypothetical protein [Vibrio fluvialis]|uniref:hypothetical protein n=1 Tax=Vibrio fluvialis TaxID=676 RepID=UPI001F34969F|nr:hypothetical protein [Vibrio fluvialis]MCE7604563.1 hypothetical protein [Vibrio fluvialis]